MFALKFQPGDRLVWRADHPDQKEMIRDFGPGPFRVRGVEEGAPEGGLWLSLENLEGLTYVKGAWKALQAGPPYPAVPPTFHSDWLELEVHDAGA
jgi:hypothetical protein